MVFFGLGILFAVYSGYAFTLPYFQPTHWDWLTGGAHYDYFRDGPFLLGIPSLGRMIRVYGRKDQMEEAEKQFLEEYQHQIPKHPFPVISLVALLYPITAMLSTVREPVPTILVLGYGFSNLGYLLGVAFVYPGHFRILGLDSRPPTIVAAVIAWLVGVLLSNI